jgi:putative membrane protein
MDRFAGWFKALVTVFWLVALSNLLWPFEQPFSIALNTLAGLLLLVHGLVALHSRQHLRAQPRVGRAVLQTVLFGAFHPLPNGAAVAPVEQGG